MKVRLLLLAACVASLFVGSASAQPSLDPRTLTADLPFAMAPVALPQIAARTCCITDHGAGGDGATLNTAAIDAEAIRLNGVDLGTARTPVETGAEGAAGAVVRRSRHGMDSEMAHCMVISAP